MKKPVAIFARKQLFRKPPKPPSFGLRLLVSFGMLVISLWLVFCTSAPNEHLGDIEVKSKEAGTRTITLAESEVRSSIVNALTKYTSKTKPLILWGIRPELLINESPAEAISEYRLRPDGAGDFKIDVPERFKVEDYVRRIIPKKDDSDTVEKYIERITGKKEEKGNVMEEGNPPSPAMAPENLKSNQTVQKENMELALNTCFGKSSKSIFKSQKEEIKINLKELMKYFTLANSESNIPDADLSKKIWNELLLDNLEPYNIKVPFPKKTKINAFVDDLAKKNNEILKSSKVTKDEDKWSDFMSLLAKELSTLSKNSGETSECDWKKIYNQINNYGINSKGILRDKPPKGFTKLTKKNYENQQLIGTEDASLFYISIGEFDIYEGTSKDDIIKDYFKIVASTINEEEADPVERFLNLIKKSVNQEELSEEISDEIDQLSSPYVTKTIEEGELINLINERIIRPSMQASEEEIKIVDEESPFKINDGFLSCDNFPYFTGKEGSSDKEIFEEYVDYTAVSYCESGCINIPRDDIYKFFCTDIWKKETLNDYKVKCKPSSSTVESGNPTGIAGGIDESLPERAGLMPVGDDLLLERPELVHEADDSLLGRTESMTEVIDKIASDESGGVSKGTIIAGEAGIMPEIAGEVLEESESVHEKIVHEKTKELSKATELNPEGHVSTHERIESKPIVTDLNLEVIGPEIKVVGSKSAVIDSPVKVTKDASKEIVPVIGETEPTVEETEPIIPAIEADAEELLPIFEAVEGKLKEEPEFSEELESSHEDTESEDDETVGIVGSDSGLVEKKEIAERVEEDLETDDKIPDKTKEHKIEMKSVFEEPLVITDEMLEFDKEESGELSHTEEAMGDSRSIEKSYKEFEKELIEKFDKIFEIPEKLDHLSSHAPDVMEKKGDFKPAEATLLDNSTKLSDPIPPSFKIIPGLRAISPNLEYPKTEPKLVTNPSPIIHSESRKKGTIRLVESDDEEKEIPTEKTINFADTGAKVEDKPVVKEESKPTRKAKSKEKSKIKDITEPEKEGVIKDEKIDEQKSKDEEKSSEKEEPKDKTEADGNELVDNKETTGTGGKTNEISTQNDRQENNEDESGNTEEVDMVGREETNGQEVNSESTDQSDKEEEIENTPTAAASRTKRVEKGSTKTKKGKQTDEKNINPTEKSKEKERPAWFYWAIGITSALGIVGGGFLLYYVSNLWNKKKQLKELNS